jgi:hypothetical protein
VTDAMILDRLLPCLPPDWKPSASSEVDVLYSLVVERKDGASSPHCDYRLYAGPTKVTEAVELDEALAALQDALQHDVALKAQHHLFVQAGVVGWQDRAIVIPGDRLSGNRALVAELVRAGAAYYSDTFAVFDLEGHVHPYARPLDLAKTKRLYENPEVAQKPLKVGLIALVRYQPGGRWRPKVVTPGKALLALFENAVAPRDQGERTFGILRQAVRDASALQGTRGTARTVARVLLRHLC